MDQISFFSAEASGPELADLAGVLCGPATIASFGRTAARLSVPVAEPWRARVLANEFARRGVGADAVTEQGWQCVRTAFRVDLIGLAKTWCPDGIKVTTVRERKRRAASRTVPGPTHATIW